MQIIGAFNRNEVKDLVPRKGSVLISITCKGEKFPEVNQKWTDILQIQFDDNYEGDEHSIPMTDEQAKEIISFAIKHLDKDFFVNCDAGLSRSPAVIVALEQIFNARDVSNVDKFKFHNKYVKNKIKNVWFKNIWNG